MGVNYARLAFVHRLVTNFYEAGLHDTARKFLERHNGRQYLEEVEEQLRNENDSAAENQLANLWFVWWRITSDVSARNKAESIWFTMHEGEFGVHAAHMLAYLALMDQSTSPDIVQARIARLNRAKTQTSDVERINRLAELVRRLEQQFDRRCQK
jgi:arginine decarboxylase-like protein